MENNDRRAMEATILLLGWQPIIRGFDENLVNLDRHVLLRLSMIGAKGYITESDTRQIHYMDAMSTPCEMHEWSDLRVECFYNRIMEIENVTEDN